MNTTNKVVIFGAGAAGLACAISAAQQGAAVHLIEKTAHLGGTVAHSLIHTIGGLYDDEGAYLNAGLPIELAELLLQADTHSRKRQMGKVWTLSVDPALYAAVIEAWIERYANITVLCNTYPTDVQTLYKRAGAKSQVTQVEVVQASKTEVLPVDVLVDATGSAAVVRLIDPSLVVAGDALAGLIFQIRGVAPNALKFPKNVGLQRNLQKAVETALVPQVFAQTWFDIGVYADEIYAKVSILASAYAASAVATWAVPLLNFLQTLPDFADARLERVGQLGIRDGGRIVGDYCLTLADVKAGRTFADAVGRCAWPIEYWDPEKGVTLEYLPAGHSYETPLRCLKVAGMENVWAAGKCLSAEKLAQASARVAGTCWAMGDGLGKAIARKIYHESI